MRKRVATAPGVNAVPCCTRHASASSGRVPLTSRTMPGTRRISMKQKKHCEVCRRGLVDRSGFTSALPRQDVHGDAWSLRIRQRKLPAELLSLFSRAHLEDRILPLSQHSATNHRFRVYPVAWLHRDARPSPLRSAALVRCSSPLPFHQTLETRRHPAVAAPAHVRKDENAYHRRC
jgi:hypothetical protein